MTTFTENIEDQEGLYDIALAAEKLVKAKDAGRESEEDWSRLRLALGVWTNQRPGGQPTTQRPSEPCLDRRG